MPDRFLSTPRPNRRSSYLSILTLILLSTYITSRGAAQTTPQLIRLDGHATGPRFDGIGVVDGGGATSVLLKDYPEPQRSQILDLLYKPKFGASVSALLTEIPGDGNSTQGSMPSHMHTRDDLNFRRGYTWWILSEAKKRNPNLTLTGTAWSAPAWVGNGNFWSQDAADYYIKWLTGLKSTYGLQFNALGMRNEKGTSFEFARLVRSTLDANGFANVKVQGFDNWPQDKVNFVQSMVDDPANRNLVDIISGHTLTSLPIAAGDTLKSRARLLDKPIWDSEEHVYKKGFDCEISIVQAFNQNFIQDGATLVVNWYGIAGLYPLESYSEDPAALLARSPWSGSYTIREALWGYAHYGQFTQPGWQYLEHGYGQLQGGGTFVTLKSPKNDYSIILETKDAKSPQTLRVETTGGLSSTTLHIWRSNATEQFTRQPDIQPSHGGFTLVLDPASIYSITTTTGQQKGAFPDVPAEKPFPFPYADNFDAYTAPQTFGYLPHYTADIEEAFEIADCPSRAGKCLHQAVPVPPNSWAPEWQPYTILGDDQWTNYDVSSDVYLKPSDSAGVMGRINFVGWGYGTDPKGYYLQLTAEGLCRLIAIRGPIDKKALTGDAEQQAILRANKDFNPGGELVLGSIQVPDIAPNTWHNLKLRLSGPTLTGFVDGRPILTATDTLYAKGMAGLLAGAAPKSLSTPFYDNLIIKPVDAPDPPQSPFTPQQQPIYPGAK
jgi:galactosylceramidase